MFRRKKAKAQPPPIPFKSFSANIIGAEAEAEPVQPRKATPISDKDGYVVIGKGTRVSGAISACQVLDVYGVVEADVSTERLIVREGGGIRGSVQADNADISGVVEGALTAHEHLELNATGEVRAEVKYQTLTVAKGAVLKGSISLEEDADAQPAEAPSTFELPDVNIASIRGNGFYKPNGKA